MKYEIFYRRYNQRKSIMLERNTIKNVKDCKKELSKVNYILPEYIVLKFKSVTLKDDADLDSCVISDNCETVMYVEVMVQEVHETNKDGKICFRLLMDFDDTIRDLRKKYCTKVNVPDVIFTCGRECREKEYLSQFLNKSNCIFTAFSVISVLVTNEHGSTYETKSYENDTLGTIRTKLLQKGFINNINVLLMTENRVLSGESKLHKYGKLNPFIIFVGIVISVNYKHQHLMDLTINVDTKISYIKMILSEKLGKEPNLISLFIDKQCLNDEETIGSLKMKCNDQLEVFISMKVLISCIKYDELIEYLVKKYQRIIDIKEEMSAKCGINVEKISLSLHNEELKDETSIDSLNFNEETILQMAQNDGNISLTVINKCVCSTEDNNIRISVDCHCTIDYLRNLFSRQLNFDISSIDLYHLNKGLDDGSIDGYGVKDGDTLVLRSKKPKENIDKQFILKVRHPTNNVQAYVINNFQTVHNFKLIIRDQYNVNINYIKLFFGDIELQDGDVIMDLHIDNTSTLNLVINNDAEHRNEEINITVSLSIDDKIDCRDIAVYDDDTISSLRHQIGTVFCLSSFDYVLSFNGQILRQENMIHTYNIGNGDEIVVSHSLLIRYVVNADNMTAKVNRYAFKIGDKVSDLKLKIEKKISIEIGFINLLFNGEFLKDEQNLKEVGIMNQSYLFMVSTLAGGH